MTDGWKVAGPPALVAGWRGADAGHMKPGRTFVMTDPATDQVLWVCSGAAADGRCPHAAKPPYVCHGLRVVATHGTSRDGTSFVVSEMAPGRCPAVWIDEVYLRKSPTGPQAVGRSALFGSAGGV